MDLNELRSSTRKAGLSPGTVVFTGKRRAERTRITVTDFDPERLEETEVKGAEGCVPYRDSPTVSWVDLVGLRDVAVLEQLGLLFSIHPLVLEDIAHTTQRPKLEEHGDSLFIVLRAIVPVPGSPDASTDGETGAAEDDSSAAANEEQVSLILGRHCLLTFREQPSPLFDAVRQRIRASRGRIRRMGVDYLAYTLMDAVVDHYFIVLEAIAEELDDVEEALLENPGPQLLQRLHTLRKRVMRVRRAAWPIRDMLNTALRGESDLFDEATLPYLRDLQDHTLQVIDIVENFRDVLTSLMDVYLSSLSQRTNEVMKVLTVIATVFIPLTFVAGVYGMNFKFMPELQWHWSYAAFWVAMAVITAIQVYYMRRKGWF